MSAVTAEDQRAAVRWSDEYDGLAALVHNLCMRPRTNLLRSVRLARDLTAERARTAEVEADRDALAAKIETMLADEEDARALRLAEHAAREDVAGKLADLQAAVRAHEADARASGHAVPQRDLDLWAAAKA